MKLKLIFSFFLCFSTYSKTLYTKNFVSIAYDSQSLDPKELYFCGEEIRGAKEKKQWLLFSDRQIMSTNLSEDKLCPDLGVFSFVLNTALNSNTLSIWGKLHERTR